MAGPMDPLRLQPGERLFVLTGAGVSAESGIPTFRDSNGLWRNFRVEEVASPHAWARDPELVWQFYSWRREVAARCSPHAGHAALTRIEQSLGERCFFCTQNVDDLHEQAGSTRAWHMHGELFKSRCDRCSRLPFPDRAHYPTRASIARCECGGAIRPHICWFGEVPFFMDEIHEAAARANVIACAGTSGVVYPAAGLVNLVKSRPGTRAVYVGPEAPANIDIFDVWLRGPASQMLPELARRILGS